MRRTVLAAVVAVCAAVPASASAQIVDREGHIPKCTEAVPARISPDTIPVTIDVYVLLDGVSQADGEAIFAKANDAYSREGLALSPTFETFSISVAGNEASGYNAAAKGRFDGVRPAGFDVVYTLTSDDIAVSGQTAVAGLADCIGGVAFPENAFAVGEEVDDIDPISFGPLRFFGDLGAKVAAHEIGHLFGGHHHYANCAESLSTAGDGEATPCTLMFNDISFQALQFGALNGAVVRGHAQAYAANSAAVRRRAVRKNRRAIHRLRAR